MQNHLENDHEKSEAGGQEYEVLAPGTAPHYRWSDPYRITLRIHTKEVA